MGIGGDWPLWIAFVALAACTYSCRAARALIAFVKDLLIYIVVLVAIIYVPYKLGGYDVIFHGASNALTKSGTAGLSSAAPSTWGIRPWPQAPHWHCSCTRTR
jgi:SSS family solute:Na+ symporter